VTVNGSLAAHYEYDGNGNRLSVTRPGTGTLSGTYDAQDRLLVYGSVSYTYTPNGELQTATSRSETTTYAYDVFGNLTIVTLPDGGQIEYVIDGQNRRIGKKVNGVLTQAFLYSSQLRPAAELDGSGAVVARFVYGTRINVPDYVVKAGTAYRILTDHLGSVRLVVDAASGAVVQRLDYDEFGQVTGDTNPGFQPFAFAGGLYDPDTKLVRFDARDYDPFTGRWTAKDPALFEGHDTNLFAYVFNSPQDSVDPFGLQQRTPASGPPNSQQSFPGGTDRIYGPDGRAVKDIDHGHNHGAGDPHVHDWDWSKPDPRQPGRAPKPGELPAPSPKPNPTVPLQRVPWRWPGPFIIIIDWCVLDPTLPGCPCPGLT
jgi:RHS repeat-associated protein